ncbi:MAG: gene transfer agent family protein [Asticcacaulis sp.]|uniref:gene transfer agent family protein n=1 Tax=Asticcacaulis sp. TaxID=1872648 RepID=UPI0039E44486
MPQSRLLANSARGEVLVALGGAEVRLCVTLGALAALEGHFQVSGFEGLAERLKGLGAADLTVVLRALAMDDLPEGIGLAEAIRAVVRAFEAMNAN